MTRTHKGKKRGGDFFGEGTYGCTFSPPPSCSGAETNIAKLPHNHAHIMAKIFRKQEELDNEWSYATQIAKIDPEQKIFLYSAARCETSSKNVRADPQSRSCTILKSVPRKPTTMYMSKMKRGGMTLDDLVRKNSVSLQQIIPIMLPVLEGIRKLIKNKLIHHDLKFDNVLYDPVTKTTNIIDFGLMVSMTGVYDPSINEFLYSDYWLHPPEYHIAKFIYDNPNVIYPVKEQCRRTSRQALELLDVYFDDMTKAKLKDIIINRMFGGSECDYDDYFMNYMKAVYNHRRGIDAINYMAKHANKIDVYSFGIILTYISTYLSFQSPVEKQQYFDIVKMFVHPDPRKRPGPTKAATMLKSVL